MAEQTKEALENERLRNLEILKNSYEMYEKSKKEMLEVRKNRTDKNGNRIYTDESAADTLELMETMQQDIKIKYIELGGDEQDLINIKNSKKKNIDRKALLKTIATADEKDSMKEYLSKMNKKLDKVETAEIADNKPQKIEKAAEDKPQYKVSPKLLDDDKEPVKEEVKEMKVDEKKYVVESTPSEQAINSKVNDGQSSYDSVNLPSKGECYAGKFKSVDVNYLTAYDENIILSPNLYRSGTFLDHILKHKVRGIDPDDLVQGDRDAIIIWLRASGYGNEYPVTVTDDKTGEDFDTVVDLSQLNYRKFTLKGDENGYFDFKLPLTGDEIKFKFLTNRDIKKLKEMADDEDEEIRKDNFEQGIALLKKSISETNIFSDEQFVSILDKIETIEKEGEEAFQGVESNDFTHELTNRLILSTVSVNGNTDRNFIINYILNLNVQDAKAYRSYILDNEPGINYNIKVKRPDSLGGGYFTTFLQLDQFIFISKL